MVCDGVDGEDDDDVRDVCDHWRVSDINKYIYLFLLLLLDDAEKCDLQSWDKRTSPHSDSPVIMTHESRRG